MPDDPVDPFFGWISGVNLALLLAFGTWVRFHSVDVTGLILYALWIMIHAAVAATIGANQKASRQKAWYLGALLVLLIGFGTCVAWS